MIDDNHTRRIAEALERIAEQMEKTNAHLNRIANSSDESLERVAHVLEYRQKQLNTLMKDLA